MSAPLPPTNLPQGVLAPKPVLRNSKDATQRYSFESREGLQPCSVAPGIIHTLE